MSSSFTHPLRISLLLLNTKEGILKNVDNQTVLAPIDFFVHSMEVNEKQSDLVASILQNTIFCVPQKKEINTGLDFE